MTVTCKKRREINAFFFKCSDKHQWNTLQSKAATVIAEEIFSPKSEKDGVVILELLAMRIHFKFKPCRIYSSFLPLLLLENHFVVLFSPTESQLLNITSQPTSPVSVLEGQPLRLEWTFSVQRTFRRVQLSISGEAVAFMEQSLTSIFLNQRFTDRLTASTTETNATITFLSLNRTDSNDYVFAVLDTSGGTVQSHFKVVVQCKYERLLPSLLLIEELTPLS